MIGILPHPTEQTTFPHIEKQIAEIHRGFYLQKIDPTDPIALAFTSQTAFSVAEVLSVPEAEQRIDGVGTISEDYISSYIPKNPNANIAITSAIASNKPIELLISSGCIPHKSIPIITGHTLANRSLMRFDFLNERINLVTNSRIVIPEHYALALIAEINQKSMTRIHRERLLQIIEGIPSLLRYIN